LKKCCHFSRTHKDRVKGWSVGEMAFGGRHINLGQNTKRECYGDNCSMKYNFRKFGIKSKVSKYLATISRSFKSHLFGE